MKDSVSHCRKQEDCQQLNDILYLKNNLQSILKNPVILEFLKDPLHKNTFYTALNDPSDDNLNRLNKQFKSFYRINRAIRYLSGFIKRYPTDYNKRVRRRQDRYQLILNKPATESSDTELALLLQDTSQPSINFNRITNTNFPADNEDLLEAINVLTEKQRKILTFYYEYGYTHKEIGRIFEESEQNISYWHKKTLKQLRDYLKGVENK
ncbi:sigma-70 family RNA polymerase sigma factor [Bacillus sp. S17B2]|uniref:sigma-70 family RNA polymerase sigma factor n=1 Tax=Bacillus sp. S17B2 TaxID=2918907 RepID=UPI0022804DBB|nr:sigma-70 family RNA polymerase sigma factor [Bacillus sp. S17B2]